MSAGQIMEGFGQLCACPCAYRLAQCDALGGRQCKWQTIPAEFLREERKIFFELADLARIRGGREVFCMAGHWMVVSIGQALNDHYDHGDKAFIAANAAIRAAADAVSALSAKQKHRIGQFLRAQARRRGIDLTKYPQYSDPALGTWPTLFFDLIEAFASVAWENPIYEPRSGAGGRKGRRADFPFRTVVWGLLLITDDFGGRLRLDHKNHSGSLLKALDLLRPYSFFEEIIPVAPPISTIRRVVEDFRTQSRERLLEPLWLRQAGAHVRD
jgi:hypothetical protein